MKYKIAFILILTLIVAVGINGIDIAGYFFSDDSLEETVIDRNSVKSNAVYIASPDEISFNPMETIETGNNSAYYETQSYSSVVYGKKVCTAILEALSGYYDKAEYYSPIDKSIEESICLSSNGYFYLDGYRYLNSEGDTRLLDCIICSGNYRIIYINFYSDSEYTTETNDISEGLNKFREYSEKFYTNLENIENEIPLTVHEYYYSLMDADPMYVYMLSDIYRELYQIFKSESEISNQSNPVEYFWIYSTLISQIYFRDIATAYYDNSDYVEEFYEISVYGVQYIIENILTVFYETGDSFITDDTEYVAYNGRIYQTIKFNDIHYYFNTLIVIYNISENIVEGFYVPDY